MPDSKLRELQRRFTVGDLSVEPELLAARVRAGLLDADLVRLAAHIGYEPASRVDLGEVSRPCGCEDGCYRCNDTQRLSVANGLIGSAQDYPIPIGPLSAWACDCVERAIRRLPEKHLDRPNLLNIVEMVRRWRETRPGLSAVLASLAENATVHPDMDHIQRAVQDLVLGAANNSRQRPESIWRANFAGAASQAYRASGHKRDERDWQIRRLARHLLE